MVEIEELIVEILKQKKLLLLCRICSLLLQEVLIPLEKLLLSA